jgi:hypothetical protein
MRRSLAELLADPAVHTVLLMLANMRDGALKQGRSAEELPVSEEIFPRVMVPAEVLAELDEVGLIERREGDYCLTEAGHKVMRQLAIRPKTGNGPSAAAVNEIPKPRWVSGDGTLWLGHVLVKIVTRWARTERALLDHWQAADWAPEVRTPFFKKGVPDTRRLREAVRSLNAGQITRRLRFAVCPGGQRVRWVKIEG